jgi:hypothetical protein
MLLLLLVVVVVLLLVLMVVALLLLLVLMVVVQGRCVCVMFYVLRIINRINPNSNHRAVAIS